VYHLNLTTGDLVMTTSFDYSVECLASDLALGSWVGTDYAFYTACGIDGSRNLMFRIHLDTGAADSAGGFGVTGEHPPIFVDDHSSDPVHAIAYDLSDGVLGGVHAGTFDLVSACDCGNEDIAGMALAAPSSGRPDVLPPPLAATNPVTATLNLPFACDCASGPALRTASPLPAQRECRAQASGRQARRAHRRAAHCRRPWPRLPR